MKSFADLESAFPRLKGQYHFGKLDEKDLNRDPFQQFAEWFEDAVRANSDKPHAMTLATASKKAAPSGRVVLLKGFSEKGFVFYTGYKSPKAKDMAENPRAACVFYWPKLERQVRLRGKVRKLSCAESEKYFQSRPRDSQLAAWTSDQSRVISSREELEKKSASIRRKFGKGKIPLPPFWGGYRVVPREFEFWQGRGNRLNDRFRYSLQLGSWKIEQLQP